MLMRAFDLITSFLYFQSSYKNWSETAQRHGVLRKIFKYIPTNILLSSSSLVNKTWNNEARALIRDHRRCTVKSPEDTPVWKFLHNLDQLCGRMLKEGRFVPFNTLKIILPGICRSHCSLHEIFYNNLNNELKLKYVEISKPLFAEINCECHMSLVALMQLTDSEVRTLKIDSASLFYDFKYKSDWTPHFRQLEELDIEELEFDSEDMAMYERQHKELLRWLLKDAPDLRGLNVNLQLLQIVPKEVLVRVNL